MKKITLILAALTVCMSMLLTACGGSDSDSGNNNSDNSANAGNEDNAGNDSENEGGEQGNDSSADVEYVHSTFDENGKFTFEFVNIGADFDTEEWVTFDMEGLSDYNGGAVTEEELKKRLESGVMVYEMMVGKESGSNINIIVQNLGVLDLSFTEEEYIDYSLEDIEEQLEYSGTMTDPHASKSTVTFAGASRYALDVEGSSGDFELYERIVVIKKGDYMSMITITAQSAGERDEFTKIFYSL